jgi:hypothetical protein
MGFTRSDSAAILLAEIYGEPKPVNLLEAKEFSVWYDLAGGSEFAFGVGLTKKYAGVMLLVYGG